MPRPASAAREAALERRIEALESELAVTREQQAATNEVLRTIASAPAAAERALETICTVAGKLFGASDVSILRLERGMLRHAAALGEVASGVEDALPDRPLDPTSMPATAILERRPFSIADLTAPEVRARFPAARLPEKPGSVAAAPLVREGEAIGAIVLVRHPVRPFTPAELAQVQNFADQAVIAIENARLLTELRESLDRQTASAEVLGVIAASPGQLGPVFDSVLENALRLCEAVHGLLMRIDDDVLTVMAHRGLTPEWVDFGESEALTFRPGEATPSVEMIRSGRTVQIADLREHAAYGAGEPVIKAAADLGGVRTMAFVPMVKDGRVIGAINVHRREVRPFTDAQIGLLESFAAQAVIAIENARLLAELRESLDNQTASAEILRTIAGAPGDSGKALDTIARIATALFGASSINIWQRDDNVLHLAGGAGPARERVRAVVTNTQTLNPETVPGAAILEKRQIHVPDVDNLQGRMAGWPGIAPARAAGTRCIVGTPLLRQGEAVGAIIVHRPEPRPFTDKELAQLANFADQAVIAIENARLLAELRESLERRTAIAEVLQVISSSPGDVLPVFRAMLDSAVRLCEASTGTVFFVEGEVFRPIAMRGVDPVVRLNEEVRFPEGTASMQMLTTRQSVHVPDLVAYLAGHPARTEAHDVAVAQGIRSVLLVPMVKDGEVVAAFLLHRNEVGGFTEAQIGLVENFASQAVIAIENARLLAELRESLENQTASTEVLRAIASAPAEATHALDTIAKVTARLFGASTVNIHRVEGDRMPLIGGAGPAYEGIRAQMPEGGGPINPENVPGRVILTKRQVHIADLENPDPSIARWRSLQISRAVGTRSVVGTPLLRQGEVIGALVVHRAEARAFTDRELDQLANFADQAVIAIENARLLSELRDARDAAERNLGELRAAQASLIQAEKMASLGQLTAGIAHEIKNPLNFVNNFAGLSVELLDELKEAQRAAVAALDADTRADIGETMEMLTGNLEKIAEHGRRADGIVKSMLAHSRGGTGDRQSVNLNALVEEALNLAYHGARAQDQSFNITLERDLDPALAPIEVVPQELTRVFLNLFGNGFYAAGKRAKDGDNAAFSPTLSVTTRDVDGAVEIRIRDNGVGIPDELRSRLFEPFFTTKPTGEGTGLGLSISYEIVTQQHGGHIAVDSTPGQFTEFTVTLPRGAEPGRESPGKRGSAAS